MARFGATGSSCRGFSQRLRWSAETATTLGEVGRGLASCGTAGLGMAQQIRPAAVRARNVGSGLEPQQRGRGRTCLGRLRRGAARLGCVRLGFAGLGPAWLGLVTLGKE